MQPAKDRAILQVGDFVKATIDGENCILSVRERQGNYVLVGDGIRFHIIDDRLRGTNRWVHRPSGFILELP